MGGVNEHIARLREDFMKGQLSETSIQPLPQHQFAQWMQDAVDAKAEEVQAFVLSTVGPNHRPSARVVYLREFSDNTFYFYTNYQSRKGLEISQNPYGCMTFFWPELERQIRIEGSIRKAETKKSDAYFQTRPAGSRIGAWSSPQSKILENREALERLVQENATKFEGQEIPRPDFWGGYVITADYYEFWQGRKSRLHDRISYTAENGSWIINRLAP